jgi:coatomer protein complex subunit alpha (xenin)
MVAISVISVTAGRVIITTESEILLYDQGGVRHRCKNEFTKLKQSVWNDGVVAMFGKTSISIYTHELVKVCSWVESTSIKSALWVGDVLIYSTKSHIKYALLNAETGVIQST